MSDTWFSGALDLRAYKPGEWVLLEPFRYHARNGREFTVPRWFVTDLASIPWLVDPLFDSLDHRKAGVVHDWIYCSQQVSRAEADELFREMLEVLGVGVIKRNLMYSGLRVGGWYRYNQCKAGRRAKTSRGSSCPQQSVRRIGSGLSRRGIGLPGRAEMAGNSFPKTQT